MGVNVKFVIRGLILALPAAMLILAAWILIQSPLGRPLDPTPLPPTILAPRGEMPTGPIGLQEWAQVRGQAYRLVGSGFLLLLGDGEVVGVTTAHSVSIGDLAHPLERIALGIAGRSDFIAESDTLRGHPGQRLTVEDMTVDYVLLQVDQSVEHSLALSPDPRGAPQPGERVSLFSGLGDGHGGRRELEGTVQSVTDRAIWVLMDEWFQPGRMSGSPFVSQHTGQVVGMAVAASPRRNRLLLGVHPIGSIVRLAESATEFPKLIDWYEREGRSPAWQIGEPRLTDRRACVILAGRLKTHSEIPIPWKQRGNLCGRHTRSRLRSRKPWRLWLVTTVRRRSSPGAPT